MSNHNDEKLKQVIDSCAPVAWQYFHGGKWHSGNNENNHRENTEAEGFPIRDLCLCKSNKLSQPQDTQAVACDHALFDFQEGQWWVDELDALASAETATQDQKRAVAVVHNLLRHIPAAIRNEGYLQGLEAAAKLCERELTSFGDDLADAIRALKSEVKS